LVVSQAQPSSAVSACPHASSVLQVWTCVEHLPEMHDVHASVSYAQAPASAVDDAPPPPVDGMLVSPASPAVSVLVVASLLQATAENAPKPKKTVKQAAKARIIISSVEPKKNAER
jgi:hypothetical protein